MIKAMGFQRDEVFITNIVRYRPPQNRTPTAEEIAQNLPWFAQEIALIKPDIICAFGDTPLKALTNDPQNNLTRARGTSFEWNGYPAYQHSTPATSSAKAGSAVEREVKSQVWDDLKKVLSKIGLKPPKRS